jgi:hypothetical protein
MPALPERTAIAQTESGPARFERESQLQFPSAGRRQALAVLETASG